MRRLAALFLACLLTPILAGAVGGGAYFWSKRQQGTAPPGA